MPTLGWVRALRLLPVRVALVRGSRGCTSGLGADVRPCADMRYWHFASFRFMLGPLARPAQAAALAAPPTPQAARSYHRDFRLHASRGARSIPPIPSG
jgi:hypothetical protein